MPAPFVHHLHPVLDVGLQSVAAVTLGGLAARYMRVRGLHWGWTALLLALVVLAHRVLGALATPLGLCALRATVRAGRWHRDDLRSGGDLMDAALERPVPSVVLGSLVSRLATRLLSWSSAHPREDDGALLLGRERGGRAVRVPFGAWCGGHTLVLGATGSGKTVTQTLMAVRAVERGMAVIAVDPKGDRDMRERLCQAATRAGRGFLEWTPHGPSVYNPYACGGDTEIVDRLLAGERFTEPHYLRQAQRYLGHAVRALRAAGNGEISLQALVESLEPAALELLLRELPASEAEPSRTYLESLSARQLSDLTGVRDRLAILAESDVGRWLDPHTDGAPQLHLLASARERTVVYFNLESDCRPLLSQMLGAAIVQDLQSTVAALQGTPASALVLIDEFSALAAEQVVALFGRARSAGFSLLLGTQELSDLRPPGRERLLEQVMGNLSLLIAHRQVVPSSAELVARMAGSRGSWQVAWGTHGRMTRTRSTTPVLTPERLRSLAPGWAAVMELGRGERMRITSIAAARGDP